MFVALAMLASLYDRFPGDEALADALQAFDVPVLGGFFAFINRLGDGWVAVPLAFSLIGALLLVGHRWEALAVLAALLPRGFHTLVKDAVDRPRPDATLVHVTERADGSSFPSGHTVSTAVLFGVLFFVVPRVVREPLLRAMLQVFCLVVLAAAGPARVYVGVHWPSDVLGGYLLAFLALLPVVALLRRVDAARR